MPFKSTGKKECPIANTNAFCEAYCNLYLKAVIFHSFQVSVENFFTFHINDKKRKRIQEGIIEPF